MYGNASRNSAAHVVHRPIEIYNVVALIKEKVLPCK